MDVPNTNQVPDLSSRQIDMSQAPGGDLSFDDLFPLDDTNVGVTSADPGTPQTPPAPPEPKKPFLGTYATEEEAIRGLSHKDEVIETLRKQLAARDGVDPITHKPVGQPPVPQVPPQPQEVNYAVDGEKYYDDLVEAVKANDRRKYAQVQQKFFNDVAQPLVPILSRVSKQTAVDTVAQEIPEFRNFATSADFNQLLESEPLLKGAISNAENNLALANELPGLYRMAYYIAQGRRAPEIARAAAVQQPPAPPQPARPTTTPSTMTPPQPTAAPTMATSEGRKQLIRDFESRGIGDVKF